MISTGDLVLLIAAVAPIALGILLGLAGSRRLTGEGADATLGWCVLGHLQVLWRRGRP
ncbi:hypothetical protein [Methylobacterium nodulans]|uniref:Uncharacterized protein n=1 Tax=Methylobacterium nodulans (strain LMG 21967 / CNCM I-2342 / ORS 2060) TaxID=460265 RepID=B8IRI7_METNO|nr:hypothetical protein [Methylobacterium nodulans]ACL58727.1 hypothetical protein Mnod_3827 [Methylobacterium nodulans ORS 2060]